jgi:hypothetical protein
MEADTLALLIPIVAIVMGISLGMVAIVTSYRGKVKRAELRHKERLAAIDKGMEPPPEPLETDGGRRDSGLRSGIIGLLLGVVLYFALRAVAGPGVAIFGLIPAAVGIANLIFYVVEGRRRT